MDTQAKWDALSDKAKQTLLEKYRDWNTDCFRWWDCVYEQFITDMEEIGVFTSVGKIRFSGFWSQGDGASFAGWITDWEKFLAAAGKSELLPHAKADNLSFSWVCTSRYNHSGTMDFNGEALWLDNPYDEEDDLLRWTAWDAVHPEGGPVFAALEDFSAFLRGKADELYEKLEEEYEHLTSDEVIAEAIIANCEGAVDEAYADEYELV